MVLSSSFIFVIEFQILNVEGDVRRGASNLLLE